MASFQIDGDNVLEPALAPISLGVGGFVSDRLAILGNVSALLFTYSPRDSGAAESRLESKMTRSLFLGASAQWWIDDAWTLEGGVGITTLGNGPVQAQLNRGVGLPLRLGWSFAGGGGGAFSAVYELLPSFFSRGETTLSSTLSVQWQWL